MQGKEDICSLGDDSDNEDDELSGFPKISMMIQRDLIGMEEIQSHDDIEDDEKRTFEMRSIYGWHS